MSFSYSKLWKLLIDKKMMKKDLMEKTNITYHLYVETNKQKKMLQMNLLIQWLLTSDVI